MKNWLTIFLIIGSSINLGFALTTSQITSFLDALDSVVKDAASEHQEIGTDIAKLSQLFNELLQGTPGALDSFNNVMTELATSLNSISQTLHNFATQVASSIKNPTPDEQKYIALVNQLDSAIGLLSALYHTLGNDFSAVAVNLINIKSQIAQMKINSMGLAEIPDQFLNVMGNVAHLLSVTITQAGQQIVAFQNAMRQLATLANIYSGAYQSEILNAVNILSSISSYYGNVSSEMAQLSQMAALLKGFSKGGIAKFRATSVESVVDPIFQKISQYIISAANQLQGLQNDIKHLLTSIHK